MEKLPLTILCQQNGGCMGCCGHDYPSAEKINEAITLNTNEFHRANPQTKQEFLAFRNRTELYNLRFGVCRNLILLPSGRLGCPLHPFLHNGKDLREGHCDINYLCKTAKKFSVWKPEKQHAFLNFIKSKNLNNIEYSLQIDNDSLMNEFEIIFIET
ncbi:hypothetical protein HYX11_01060 [Candidatus Woesearchaeota archaeon]|nr:hypothetical protein [Candidatus Woesearchaeota archaeon]